ncbi:MAG: response regulator [Ignavibacteria bacterium]|jgi:response regulator RpfG family c-di-GMP phosphodiesterase
MENFIENRKILYVDDEPELLRSFYSLLRKEKVDVVTLQDSSQINNILDEHGPFSVVFSDQRMPVYDGVKVLETIKEKYPETVRVLVTGYSDYKDTIRAINNGGIISYIAKPWNDEELKKSINEWVGQFNLKAHNNYLMKALDEENKKLNELLNGTVAQTVRILGDITSNISPQVAVLGEKVKKIGYTFLNALIGLTPQEKWEIRRSIDLFDLGIALLPVSLQVLIEKQGLAILDNSPVARNHHLLAAGLLKDIPRFGPVARIIELQSKDFNGGGIPENVNVKGLELPLGSRLLHIIVDLVKKIDGKLSGKEILRIMRRNPLKYDTDLIKFILGENTRFSAKYEVKRIMIPEIASGMILLENIKTQKGQLLLKANVPLTETSRNILLQWHRKEPLNEPIKVRIPL